MRRIGNQALLRFQEMLQPAVAAAQVRLGFAQRHFAGVRGARGGVRLLRNAQSDDQQESRHQPPDEDAERHQMAEHAAVFLALQE